MSCIPSLYIPNAFGFWLTVTGSLLNLFIAAILLGTVNKLGV